MQVLSRYRNNSRADFGSGYEGELPEQKWKEEELNNTARKWNRSDRMCRPFAHP